jgi:hypothetical protein
MHTGQTNQTFRSIQSISKKLTVTSKIHNSQTIRPNVMKFQDKLDESVSYNLGILHNHRKHHYGHESITTTETILATNVQ